MKLRCVATPTAPAKRKMVCLYLSFLIAKLLSSSFLGKQNVHILYEIAPYVTCVLNDALQEVSIYSLSIDLSYNRSLKKKSEMDLLIRSCDESADTVL